MATRLDDLPLRAKLLLAPAVCLLLLGLSAAGALWGFARQSEAMNAIVQQQLPAYTFAARFESGLRDMNGLINMSLGYEAMGYAPKEVAVIDQALARTSSELKQLLEQQAAGADAESAGTVKALAASFAKYDRAVRDTLEIKSGGAVMAASFLTSAQKEYQTLLEATHRLSQAKLEDASQDMAAAGAAAARAQWLILVAVGSATGCGVLLSLLVARGLVQRTAWLSGQVAALADGNLTHRLHVSGRDEVGLLMADVERVRDRLSASLRAVRAASESVRVAAGEITAANTDLSQRTEQQAHRLQQTSTSMAEINATVGTTADTARQANDLAGAAREAAAQGGEVVGKVVATMADINQSSKRIADIISTIDGIAFQTNILALNAAVEAARAGEQGRGFAVVAAEVRSLAQRSAEAAREIKALISGSVDRVEAGVRYVQDAGATMDEIVNRVRRVGDLISEISAATGAQTAGIGQVSGAVDALDQVTQQNAALVEQHAAAAESLKAQALRLVESVAVFRLDDAPAAR